MSKAPETLRFRRSGPRRWLTYSLAVAVLLAAAGCDTSPPRHPVRRPAAQGPAPQAPAEPPTIFIAGGEACDSGPGDAAEENSRTLEALPFAPFHRPETGWAVYEPLIAREVGTGCPAVSPGFAAALGRWQSAHGLAGAGVLDEATFDRLKQVWEARRPFVAANRFGCPAGADEASLAGVPADQSYGGKALQLTPGALAAYEQMVSSARESSHAVADDPRLLTIFSAYRSPDADAARCAVEGNCNGFVRATCSAHRTGAAIDVFLGAAPGYRPDDSDDANRQFMSRSPAYRWMVRNASRFGFAPYPFEPWHWEWTGDAAAG